MRWVVPIGVLLFFFRLRLKPLSEVIQRLVEEVPNCVVELLNAYKAPEEALRLDESAHLKIDV
jgi:hypothetical protein